MNTLYLRYAVEIEKTGSISQAANNLYMGQPNLSKAIRELEASLGITIFHRSPKGVKPTRAGSEFLAHAKKILAQVEEMQAYCHAESRRPRFSLAAPSDGAILHAFADFLQRLDPELLLEAVLRHGGAAEIIEQVDEGTADLGIIRFPLADRLHYLDRLREKDLLYRQLGEFEYRLLLSARHPLAAEPEISREQLASYMEIVDPDYTETEGAPPKRELRLREQDSRLLCLGRLPDAYLWTAPQPQALLDQFGLVQRVCAWRQQRCGELLIYQREHPLSEVEQAFVAALANYRQVDGGQ